MVSDGRPLLQQPLHIVNEPGEELQTTENVLSNKHETELLINFIQDTNETTEKHQFDKQIWTNMNKEFNVVHPIDCKELPNTPPKEENNGDKESQGILGLKDSRAALQGVLKAVSHTYHWEINAI